MTGETGRGACREGGRPPGREDREAVDRPDREAADPPDHEAAVRELCRRADAVRQRELDAALAKLDHHGDLTPAQRAALERLSRRLTRELVGVPAAQLRAAAAAGEDEAVRAALGLFGAGEE